MTGSRRTGSRPAGGEAEKGRGAPGVDGKPRSPRPSSSDTRAQRRLVITVCPHELGAVTLPVERGGRARRLDAAAVLRHLRALVAEKGLDGLVGFREACAGGCGRAGPNVDVAIYRLPGPGERLDHIAVAWKTYVYSLASLDCLATVIEENLRAS